MESSSPADDGLSPESTVTSLLSSSGHLRSSLRPPELNSTIRYRNKDYDSASAALDAYIEDFERSCQNCRSLTGSLVLPRDPPSTPTRPRGGSLRNRDVLQERLTDRELDFLKLPVSSLRHRGNRDRLSMTTDELLSIPYDGSMPVTHTSAFIQGLLSLAAASQSLPSSTRPAHRTRTGLGSRADPLNLDQNPVPSRSRGPEDMLSSAADSSSAQRAADLHLPRWLTSNKSLMDGSEISSLPDLKHPAWIRRCDGSEPDPWDERESRLRGENGAGAPSWVSELEKDDEADQTPAQVRGSGFHGNSIWTQPGPVEAVKQMLFRLQAVEAELQRRQKEPAAPPENRAADCDAEPQGGTPSPSLQRALHHLNRLKLLVEEPRPTGREEEEEEKEEDEGRYSSLSADGLLSSEQEPS
uniref:Uncharacterized LOC108251021 n=1 Tax=Kryptolebias marmoratus TaxID=37003 RepID=A0A3Q2ZXH6_KRYMA